MLVDLPRREWLPLRLRRELLEDRPQGLDARGEGIAGIVDCAAKLLGESLGLSVGEFKVHDPILGAQSPKAQVI
jgi:hypothetical protein